MNIYWIEIKRFIKNSIKVLMLLTIITSILFTLLYLKFNQDIVTEELGSELDVNIDTENLSEKINPSYFQFYMFFEDGRQFQNESFLDSLFNSDNMYSEVVEQTNIDLNQIIEEIDELEIENQEEYSPVNVNVDGSSYIITTTIEIGNDAENREVATYYYEKLFNDGFPGLENYEIYSLTKPTYLELDLVNEVNGNIDAESETSSRIIYYIKNTILGIGTAIFFSLGLVLIFEMFSKNLNYTFAYNTGSPEEFMLYNQSTDNESLIYHFIGRPVDRKNKVILLESKNNNILEFTGKNNPFGSNNKLENIKIIPEKSLSALNLYVSIDEIIIVVISEETSREWYNAQLNLSKLYDSPIKVLQINSVQSI